MLALGSGMEPSAAVPLSAIVDRMAARFARRDRDFVRAFARWLHEKGAHLRLAPVEALGLRDVVVTFQMKARVRLLVTGYPPGDLPGEVTLAIDEPDFPRVDVLVTEEPRPDPYEVCTLDYSWAGRRVRIGSGPHAGEEGTVLVAATVGDRQECRLRLATGDVVTVPAEAVEPRP